MKKTIALLLVLAALAGLLPGCTQSSVKVAFLVYDGQDTFIGEMMEKIGQEMPPDITWQVRDAGGSQARQNQQILELIEDGYNLLVINAVDRMACSSIVEKCAAAGVNVIFFNREPLGDAMNGDGGVYYVGADADSLGRKQADLAAECFAERANGFALGPYDNNKDGVVQLVILKGEQGHQDAEKRTDTCVARLKELGYEVEVLAIEPANWSRKEAQEAMRRLYAEYGTGIELVFANNDDMALGALDYLLEAGVFDESQGPRSQPFLVIGVDGTSVALESIQDRTLYGTVLNDSVRQADAILTLIEYLLEGKDMADFPYAITNEHYIYIDGDAITRQNLPEYLE